jgi:hypothetical protein
MYILQLLKVGALQQLYSRLTWNVEYGFPVFPKNKGAVGATKQEKDPIDAYFIPLNCYKIGTTTGPVSSS